MDRKENEGFLKSGKKTEDKQASFKRIVSEGSMVVLDARDLIKDFNTNSIKHYSWEQTAGIPIANDVAKDMPSLSFPAPYVQGSMSIPH